VLEDANGNAHEVTGEDLASLLQDERSLGLAVLNACEGARTSHVDPFSGVASSLVQCGIPAVIGMQFEVTDAAAIAFAERLYSALAQGFPVDAALAQARRAIFTAGNDIEFGTPVLFLRSGATRLFEIDAAAPRRTVAPEPQVPPPKVEPVPPQPPPSAAPPTGDMPVIPAEQIPERLNGFERLYLRKALKKLPGLLEDGEVVHAAVAGSLDSMMGTDGLTLVTDRRLLFVTGRDDRDVAIALGDIGSVSSSPAPMETLKLTVVHGKDAAIITGMTRDKGEELVALLRRAVGET
jgi:hypothetical protein